MTTIHATSLTTFAIAPDGGTVSIGIADRHGERSALILPTACLQAMVMTLPDMAQQALRRKYADPAIRLVFPVETWSIETTGQTERIILTLKTADGFQASFALFVGDLAHIFTTALAGEAASPGTVPPAPQHH